MERKADVSGMHLDDITRYIEKMMYDVIITDSLGNPLHIKAMRTEDGYNESKLVITDHKGREGWAYIGIGR